MMTTELYLLVYTTILAMLQIGAAGQAKSAQAGQAWSAGPRDTPPPVFTGIAGRLDRAARNLLETLPLFAILVLVAHVAGRNGRLTLWGTELFFWSRLLYVPAYVAGIPYVRSLIWLVSVLGLILLLVAVL